ncbi:MAG TPA: monofunctional biosynthetic peptidoglycan transglycosylase [Hyphomicrobiaceae bacterium]|nr:monofunctional biosynthetic peptidoglycan transglycosylase [Hyphomicrobiaceae bacterium]
MTDATPDRPSDIAVSGRTQADLGRNLALCLRVALVSGTRVLVLTGLSLLAAATLYFAVFRFVDPPISALMLTRLLGGQSIDQRWVPLGAISPHLVRSVIIAEDGQFCRHQGIDLRELEAELKRATRVGDGEIRGASTISMQVSKNLLLWQGRSYLRKGLELALTVLMEVIWPKPRILEVYLNIAEWGPGIFGAEAAARHHFGKSASRLTSREAALLAAALPNPFLREAGNPGPGTRRLAALIEGRARAIGNRASCILGR